MASQRDPAALFYIDTWLTATAEMDSDVRGWYLNLILHNYDKKSLPNDIEKLGLLAGVKFSEFERFKQVYEQVLKQKFELNEDGRLENKYAKSIIQGREQFKDKRSKSGNIGYCIKLALNIKGYNKKAIEWLKEHLYNSDIEYIEQAKSEQVLEQMLKLYINTNENEDINTDSIELRKQKFKDSIREHVDTYGKQMCTEFYEYWIEANEGGKKMKFEMEKTFQVSARLKRWKGNESKFTKPALGQPVQSMPSMPNILKD